MSPTGGTPCGGTVLNGNGQTPSLRFPFVGNGGKMDIALARKDTTETNIPNVS